MEKLMIKKCPSCKMVVRVIKDCTCENCGIKCCEKELVELIPNSTEASFEKHIPNYEKKDGKLLVTVEHVMEDNHYIEWISCFDGKNEQIVYLKPGEVAYAEFEYKENMVIYAYCNLHELWENKVV